MEELFESLRKYNFWEGKVVQTGQLRSYYLDKIFAFHSNKLIKVIIGQRRTGKSFVLRQIIHQLILNGTPPQNIFYINKEYLDFDAVENYKHLDALFNYYKKQVQPSGKIYLLLDEIQHIEQWEKLVNSYAQDYTQDLELFISGSNSNLLSGELATLLSGRFIQFEILPFGFEEFTHYFSTPINKESYLNYLQSGGLPELFHLQEEETKRNYVNAIQDTVLLRDIVQRHTIKDVKLLEDVFTFLINNAGQLISVLNIVNFLKSKGRKTTYDTVSNYIKCIEQTFIIHKMDRYDIRGKDTISGIAKYYANDLAYKNYVYKGTGYGIGHQLENLIYLELKRYGFSVYAGVLPNKEVDFVAQKSGKTLYIQSTYLMSEESTIEREFTALASIRDNHTKVVVSLDDLTLTHPSGILHLQAWNFPAFLRQF